MGVFDEIAKGIETLSGAAEKGVSSFVNIRDRLNPPRPGSDVTREPATETAVGTAKAGLSIGQGAMVAAGIVLIALILKAK